MVHMPRTYRNYLRGECLEKLPHDKVNQTMNELDSHWHLTI